MDDLLAAWDALSPPAAWAGFLLLSWLVFGLRIAAAVQRQSPADRAAFARQITVGLLVWAGICLFAGAMVVATGAWYHFGRGLTTALAQWMCEGTLTISDTWSTHRFGQRVIGCAAPGQAAEPINWRVWPLVVPLCGLVLLTLLMWLTRYGLRPARPAGDRTVLDSSEAMRARMQANAARLRARDGRLEAPAPAAQRLQALQQLLDQGLISQAEYAAKRAQILQEL